jgi:soluble lytic murein transglycosylase
MRTLCKVFVVAALALASVNTAWAHTKKAPPPEQSAIEKAFKAAGRNAWSEALKRAKNANDPLAVKIIEWLRYQETDPRLSFAAIAGFIDANPNWPRKSKLRRAAETAIDTTDDDATVADWFQRFPPLSGAGALAHLDALMALGQLAEARALVPQYWQDLNFTRDQDKKCQRKYGKHLANADHLTRLDRLIWDSRYWPAQRMLPRVDKPQAALGRARLALMRREAGVDGAIARVPANLRQAPSLQYERLRWRRRKGMDQSAREILFTAPPLTSNLDRWAKERLILARRAILNGHYSEAQRLVAPHELTSGAEFAEAEFLAGWISLTFLNEPDAAYQHFTRLHDGVSYPISRARGAFWAGRAASAAGDEKGALRWWTAAAEFPATFYGQQAIAALGKNKVTIPFTSPQNPAVTPDSLDPELVEVVQLLHHHQQPKLIRPFLRKLTSLSKSLEQRFAVIQLANDVEQPREAIRAAKRLAQIDKVVPKPGYPSLPFETADAKTAKQQKKAPLILALIRQESAFDPRAVSRVGARGMMQLMPATAKRVARATGQSYSRARLLDDPRYNVSLGTAYLDSMMSKYDDAPALALAAYNAGPSRVNRWLRQIGDPRKGEVALIDWIEAIPFEETRNYVQRVLESETVYRELLLSEQLASVPGNSGEIDLDHKRNGRGPN